MDKKNLVYPYNTIAFKRKEILTHGATWMNLENMIGEINQIQKGKYYMVSLI